MIVTKAWAQDGAASLEAASTDAEALAAGADAGSLMTSNLLMILILVVMFYFLLIRPQQKRFKEHSEMLGALKKGDKVVTAGGLVGKVDKIGDDEIVVDLGGGTKVTALRHTIQNKVEKDSGSQSESKKDSKQDDDKKSDKK